MRLLVSRLDRCHASRLKRTLLAGAALLLMLGATVAVAQAPSSGSDEPVQGQPEMQAQAVQALNKLGVYLRTLQSFRIDADSVTDAVLTTGQNVGFLHHTELLGSTAGQGQGRHHRQPRAKRTGLRRALLRPVQRRP